MILNMVTIKLGISPLLSPVHGQNKATEAGDDVADVVVVPDSDREGQEEDDDHGHVGQTVQQDHPVYQVLLLDLQPEQHREVDGEHSQVGGDEDDHVE